MQKLNVRASSIEQILYFNLITKSKFIIINTMDRKCLSSEKKRHYSQISIKRRQAFVNCIIESGIPLSKSAKRFSIKLSTAKLIYKKYRETGQFFPKRIRNDMLNSSIESVCDQNLQMIDNSSVEEAMESELEDNQIEIQNFQNDNWVTYLALYYFQYWIFFQY